MHISWPGTFLWALRLQSHPAPVCPGAPDVLEGQAGTWGAATLTLAPQDPAREGRALSLEEWLWELRAKWAFKLFHPQFLSLHFCGDYESERGRDEKRVQQDASGVRPAEAGTPSPSVTNIVTLSHCGLPKSGKSTGGKKTCEARSSTEEGQLAGADGSRGDGMVQLHATSKTGLRKGTLLAKGRVLVSGVHVYSPHAALRHLEPTGFLHPATQRPWPGSGVGAGSVGSPESLWAGLARQASPVCTLLAGTSSHGFPVPRSSSEPPWDHVTLPPTRRTPCGHGVHRPWLLASLVCSPVWGNGKATFDLNLLRRFAEGRRWPMALLSWLLSLATFFGQKRKRKQEIQIFSLPRKNKRGGETVVWVAWWGRTGYLMFLSAQNSWGHTEKLPGGQKLSTCITPLRKSHQPAVGIWESLWCHHDFQDSTLKQSPCQAWGGR